MSKVTTDKNASAGQGLTGRHVLVMILGFFGVVFAVNGVFLYSALSTYTGVVSAEPYVKGLRYNERIAADERQARLGWSTDVEASAEGRLTLTVTGDGGRPIDHLTVTADIGRPSTNQLDRRLSFAGIGEGRYVTDAGPLDQGAWLIAAELRSKDYGADPVYRLRRRLWLKP